MHAPVTLYHIISNHDFNSRGKAHPSTAVVDSARNESTIVFSASCTPVALIPFASCRSSGCVNVSCRSQATFIFRVSSSKAIACDAP